MRKLGVLHLCCLSIIQVYAKSQKKRMLKMINDFLFYFNKNERLGGGNLESLQQLPMEVWKLIFRSQNCKFCPRNSRDESPWKPLPSFFLSFFFAIILLPSLWIGNGIFKITSSLSIDLFLKIIIFY